MEGSGSGAGVKELCKNQLESCQQLVKSYPKGSVVGVYYTRSKVEANDFPSKLASYRLSTNYSATL